MMMNASALSFQDIKLGAVYEFKKKITRDEGMSFVKLVGNYNPLHIDESYASKTIFGKTIVHGMLAASLFSTLLGMYCPGKKSLCLSQSLQFKLPIYYGDEVIVRGSVIGKNDTTQMITLRTEITKDGKVLISGEAKVILIEEKS